MVMESYKPDADEVKSAGDIMTDEQKAQSKIRDESYTQGHADGELKIKSIEYLKKHLPIAYEKLEEAKKNLETWDLRTGRNGGWNLPHFLDSTPPNENVRKGLLLSVDRAQADVDYLVEKRKELKEKGELYY